LPFRPGFNCGDGASGDNLSNLTSHNATKKPHIARCQTQRRVGPRVELTAFLHFFYKKTPTAYISFHMLHDARYLAGYSVPESDVIFFTLFARKNDCSSLHAFGIFLSYFSLKRIFYYFFTRRMELI
jgi:hypothetical protein